MWDNDDSMPIELDLEFGMAYGDGGGGEGRQRRRLMGAPNDEDGDLGNVYESDSYYQDDFNDIAVQDNQDDDGSDDDAASDDEEGGDATGDGGFASTKSLTMHNKMPRKFYQPSSLLHLATQMVASNLELINPGAIGLLSEYHWDAVVQERARKHENTACSNNDMESSTSEKALSLIAMDGNSGKRRLPALSGKFLIPIEQHPNNVHLSHSKMADDLLWQEIVDYTFSGMNRPQSLEFPCSIVKERLKKFVDDLLEIMARPLTEEEFTESLGATHVGDEGQEENSRKRRRENESDEARHNDCAATACAISPSEMYQYALKTDSQHRTNYFQFILIRLTQTPMDVELLAETGIGKSLNKCIKTMKKLIKLIIPDDIENEKSLLGYPRFWIPCRWDDLYPSEQYAWSHIRRWETLKSPLEVMQHIVQDWKDMASLENGVNTASQSPAKKQSIENNQPPITIATCGRGKNISMSQHQIDMKLLHSSPDWRSLYQSLKNREEMVKKMQGDRVRSIRENLEKARPKIGKVVLKKAVGRVRGRDDNDTGFASSAQGMHPFGMNNVGVQQSWHGPISAQSRQQERREAILSKSLGHRSRRQQLLARNASSHSSNGKLSQIRSESKIAASWSKSSISDTKTTSSSFGSAVARANGSNGNGRDHKKQQRPGSQVCVELGHGKQMKLPPSFASGAGKTVGAYSSLQKKMSKKQK